MSNNPKDHIIVFGGSGSIGSGIVSRLLSANYFVTSISRGRSYPKNEGTYTIGRSTTNFCEAHCDVTNEQSVERCFLKSSARQAPLYGLVYAVGNCPRGGFDEEIHVPLTALVHDYFKAELDRHVNGLLNVIGRFRCNIKQSGHVTVIGSAITRLTDDRCPPWLHAGHYATAKAAQEELIRWLRRDPNLKKHGILVHRLAPAAVDTPFHEGCEHQPPAMLSIDSVAEAVLEAMQGTNVVDRMMVA